MTISAGTLIAFMFVGVEAGVVPIPATQQFVTQAISDATKGLEYLVKKELAHDLDVLRFTTACMRDMRHLGALSRLEQDYIELFREPYEHKSCEELEMDPRVAAEAGR